MVGSCLSSPASVTLTVNPAPVVATRLTVLQRDPDNGQLNTNTLKPYLQLRNDGTAPIPYSEITVRYWLTVENPAPLVAQIGSQPGNGNVRFSAFPVRPGADTYLEFSFTPQAGSLAGGANSGDIQVSVRKEDYSGFNQGDDYSYVLNRDFAANPRITAYRNGQLIYGVEPAMGTRLAAPEAAAPLQIRVLGNPVGELVEVVVTGAEGEPLTLTLTDAQGRSVGERSIGRALATQTVWFVVNQQPAGVLLLRTTTPTQTQMIRVLKSK